MRWLAVVLLLGGCSKCSSETTVPDAAVAVVVPDASAPVATVADAGPEEDALVTAYARDCAFVVEQSYYEYDEDKRGDECVARNIDQSCAPDLFDCYAKGEDCRKGCGTGCQACTEECVSSCGTCREACAKAPAGQREVCVTACAKSRLKCRNDCLSKRSACLETSCATLESTCEDEGERKRKKACPDCTELGNCMWEPGFKEDHARCLERYPSNAKECLEWCFQE